MKNKIIAILSILMVLVLVYPVQGKTDNNVTSENYQVIPDKAIRLRILANSNSDDDQNLKREVRDRVNEKITKWVEELTSIKKARDVIRNNIPELENTVQQVLTEHNVKQDFKVEFKNNVQFPTKLYGSYIYPAGTYEAILITIGSGKGDNWWCVLFPPLCFLDFSNGTTVAAKDDSYNLSKEEMEKLTSELSEKDIKQLQEKKPVEVKFFLKEWLEKL